MTPTVRRAAVAGAWYPGTAARLHAQLDAHLRRADEESDESMSPDADLLGLIAPHAGLMYSGPVAAHAYRLLRSRTFDTIVLLGPSHYVAFNGGSLWRRGRFETPLGSLKVDEGMSEAILGDCPLVHERPEAHEREHSLEMQLPFLAALAPGVPIVPIVMGHQTRDTATALGDSLARTTKGRRVLLIASSDLSHFFDADTAAALDAQVIDAVDRLDHDALMARLERRPDHACGGGPMVSVMRAAATLGATSSRVLKRADSGDVSGDKSSVVGYLAAAMWR